MPGKADLVDHVANSTDGITKKQATEAIDALFGYLSDQLAAGERIQVPGFGTFLVTDSAERQGRNPKTGEAMTIAARTNVRFRPGKGLKDAVNG
jgi:DNA-binding protein HU-beta